MIEGCAGHGRDRQGAGLLRGGGQFRVGTHAQQGLGGDQQPRGGGRQGAVGQRGIRPQGGQQRLLLAPPARVIEETAPGLCRQPPGRIGRGPVAEGVGVVDEAGDNVGVIVQFGVGEHPPAGGGSSPVRHA